MSPSGCQILTVFLNYVAVFIAPRRLNLKKHVCLKIETYFMLFWPAVV